MNDCIHDINLKSFEFSFFVSSFVLRVSIVILHRMVYLNFLFLLYWYLRSCIASTERGVSLFSRKTVKQTFRPYSRMNSTFSHKRVARGRAAHTDVVASRHKPQRSWASVGGEGKETVKRDCKHGVSIKAALHPDVKWTV